MSRTPVDGVAASNTMLGFKTWTPGHCLEAVWQAYYRNGAQDVTGQSEPTAYDAWLHSPTADRRTGTPYDQIPAGVPVYFGPKASSSAGDIVISVGGGWCVATDIPGHQGVIGKIRLQDRANQIQRPYLGWTTSILGWPIKQGQGPAPSPEPDGPEEEEEEMKGAYYTRSSDKATVYLLFNEVSGFWAEHSGVNSDYNNTIAQDWKTGSWAKITEAHAKVIKTSLNNVRTGS